MVDRIIVCLVSAVCTIFYGSVCACVCYALSFSFHSDSGVFVVSFLGTYLLTQIVSTIHSSFYRLYNYDLFFDELFFGYFLFNLSGRNAYRDKRIFPLASLCVTFANLVVLDDDFK